MHITKRFDERLNRKMRAAYVHGTVGFQYAYCDCDRGFPGCTGHHAVENQRWRYPASTRIQRERTISSFLGTVNIYLSVNKNTHRTYPQLGCGKPPLSHLLFWARIWSRVHLRRTDGCTRLPWCRFAPKIPCFEYRSDPSVFASPPPS